MAAKGGQPGNNNAGKNKIWSDAVRKAILSGKRLDSLAEKLISMAEEGDIAAMKEIGDRLEGKPHQSTDMSLELNAGLATLIEAARKRVSAE